MAMLYKTFRIGICWVLIIFALACSSSKTRPTIHAQGGFLDLSSWDFDTDGIVNLVGEWEFYISDKPMTPKDFQGPVMPEKSGCISTGSVIWLNQEHRQSTDKYVAIRLRIKVKPSSASLLMALSHPIFAYEHTLWVNGELQGRSESCRRMDKMLSERTIPCRPANDLIELLVHVVNMTDVNKILYSNGHLGLGPQTAFMDQWDREKGFKTFSGTIFLFMGIYHLVLYFFRRKDPSTLYFGIYCLLSVPQADHWVIYALYSDIAPRYVWIIDQIVMFFSLPASLFFIRSLFPNEMPSRLPGAFLTMAVFLSLLLPAFHWIALINRISGGHILPEDHSVIYTPFVMVTQASYWYMLSGIILLLVVLLRAVIHKRQSSVLILSGGIILMVCGVNDILKIMCVIKTGWYFSSGLLVFICFQTCALALRFSQAFTTAEALTEELTEKNIALSKMDKIKDEFLANTSHELRTPLNGIIGLAESIRDGALGKLSDTIKEHLGLITASGRRLSGLINDLLDFSRLKNSDLHLNVGPVDMRTLTDTVLAVSKQLINGKDLVLQNRIPENLPCVQGDELRLQQILYNLVGNAIKFTNSGEVKVTAVQKDGMVEISIMDTGIGIPQAHFDTIFESFEQVQGSESRPHDGVGLGLAITRNLVELHQGSIGVSSTPNQGSTFYFTLPVSHETPAPDLDKGLPVATALSSVENNAPLPLMPDRPLEANMETAQTILAVDDDPINLQVVVNQLSFQNNVRVHTRMNGPEALEWIEQKGRPDLVLLDIMMPGMTGYEVCRTLRQKHAATDLPVIILTAKNRVTDLAQGFACGANDYLTKPFAKDELLARVRTQLDLKHSYETFKENLKLKKDIEQRKLTELDLRMMQRRLSRILDSLDDAIIAVNAGQEINFSNVQLEKLLGYEAETLLGQPVKRLFPSGNQFKIQEILDMVVKNDLPPEEIDPIENARLLHRDSSQIPCRLQFALLDMDNEQLLVMILQKQTALFRNKKNGVDQGTALLFIDELNRNRQRIQMLEDTLNKPGMAGQESGVTQGLKTIDTTLSQMEKTLTGDSRDMDKKKLGVHVMSLALQYWEASTGSTKVDLATQSGLWKVYMTRNGFERTQTLDKYLEITLLPKHPRWQKVFQTVDFVLLSCKSQSPLREELDVSFSKLRMLK